MNNTNNSNLTGIEDGSTSYFNKTVSAIDRQIKSDEPLNYTLLYGVFIALIIYVIYSFLGKIRFILSKG